MDQLAEFIAAGDLFVLTGAGLSTESGIPDYRRADGTRRAIPMTFQEFARSEASRRRYWVRSAVGWEKFRAARPNVGHDAVAAFQKAGLINSLVTQNVDGLHQAAGASPVEELHGSLATVVCLDCHERSSRRDFQSEIARLNPALPRNVELLADGDAEVALELEHSFNLAPCPVCFSTNVKPDVVMFGESVESSVVKRCFEAVGEARGVLVLGSSLHVMSGYRFVIAARKQNKPVAIVGLGTIRGADQADLMVAQPLGATLSETQRSLGI